MHSGARYRYEATVGAGLPVISTLRDLLDTGDELVAIDGILSGTLAWLCNRFDGSVPFSQLVRQAHALGYTEADRAAFMAGLESLDAPMQVRLDTARERGCVLRYVARLQRDGSARVALLELPDDHAFAHLRLTDNYVQFTTRRYCDNPLTVQGPGARPDVTSAGVFSDLLRLSAALGARL